MSDLLLNWRFGNRHLQVRKNWPLVTFRVNPYWNLCKPDKWFQRYEC